MNTRKTDRLSNFSANNTSLTLINLAKTNDQEAWETLCKLYRPLLQFWCRKYGVPNNDIDDVTQDAFRSSYIALERFGKDSSQGSFRAWLWTITRNRIRDHFRKLHDKPVATGGTDAQIHLQQVPEQEPADFETEFEDAGGLTQQALKIVRGEIEEKTFLAFWRSTIDDVGAHAVAAELGISIDSVYQAKSRVLKRMRDLLE